jgi:bromodomain-containing protein 8
MRPIIEEQTHNTAVLVEQNAPLAEQPKIAEPAPEQNVDVTMNEPSKPVPIEKVISHEEPKPIIEKPAPIAPPVHVETARVASPTKDVAPAIEDFENHKVESPDMTDDINDEEYTPIKQTKKRTAPASSKDEDEPPHKMQKLTNDDDKSPLSKKGATSVKKQEYHDALQYAPKRTTRSQSRGGSSSPPPADVIPAHTADVVPPPTEDASPQAKNKKRSVKRTEGENDEQVVENDVTKEEPLESEVVPEHDTKTKRATKKTPNKKTPNKKTPKKTKKNVQSDSEREESEVEEEKIPLEDAPKANERALPDTKILDDVLKKILQEPEAHWFEKPVTDKEVLGYTKTIFNRTDLKTIKQLVTKREIVNIKGLRHQLLLMFTNAQMFNAPDTEVHLDTIELRKKCAQWIKEAEQEEETILGPTEPAAN